MHEFCKGLGIKDIHHIHVWEMSDYTIILEAHIDLTEDICISKFETVLLQIETLLHNKYNISHINIQPEIFKTNNYLEKSKEFVSAFPCSVLFVLEKMKICREPLYDCFENNHLPRKVYKKHSDEGLMYILLFR